MGRGAMRKSKSLTFEKKEVKIGKSWLKVITNSDKQEVRVCNKVDQEASVLLYWDVKKIAH